MTVEVKQRRPLSFAVKVGVAIIVSSVLLGILLRSLKTNTSRSEPGLRPSLLVQSRTALVPIIGLQVDRDAEERHWREALAKALDGRINALVNGGTVDVLTDAYSIEVDSVKQWEMGLKRAVHYGNASGRMAVLALIQRTKGVLMDGATLNEARTVEKACLLNGVKFVVLKSLKEGPSRGKQF